MASQKQQRHASGQVPELGAIFMSNRATKEMCFSWKTFGLPYTWERFVKQVKAGMFLFLFEHETRMLYGVYQACSDGAMNFSSEAFSSAEQDYPAQVKFKVLWYCKPLSEDVFRPAIKDNYFTSHKFKFGLSRNQVKELLWLFHSRMLRDNLLWEERLPSDPSLMHGATRSCSVAEAREIFTTGLHDDNLPGNSNALELNRDLKKFSMPNIEVRGSLLLEGDRDTLHEDADFNPPINNYKRELSQQHRETPVRDRMDYSCKSNNDLGLNSAIPCTSSQRYDPDFPFLNNMQLFREDGRYISDRRVHTDNILDAPNVTSQIHFSTGHDAPDRSLAPLSDHRNSIPKIGVETAVNELRQSSAICYFEPASYDPNSNTSLQGQMRCSQVHLNPEVFRVLNNNNNITKGELLKPLSGNLLLPSQIDDASVLRQTVAYYDPSQSISHHGDALLHCSTACNSVGISNGSKVCKESQPVPQNKQSVFSRLKPALDADDECDLTDPQKSIDDMVNEVMENLSGHYCQLIRESNSPTKCADDADNTNNKNMMKMKRPQISHFEAANYGPVAPIEMVFDASTDNKEYETETGKQIIGEISCLNFKHRSEVHKKRSADEGGCSESSSAMMAEKQCKRRKLVRPSLSKKDLPNKDDMLGKISENLSLSCQPVQDGSYEADAPLSRNREQALPATGNLGSDVGSECSNGLSVSSNLSDGRPPESEKHEGQAVSGPSGCGAQQSAKQHTVLDSGVDGNSSGQHGNASINGETVCCDLNVRCALNAAADFVSGDDGSCKSAELVGHQRELRSDLDTKLSSN